MNNTARKVYISNALSKTPQIIADLHSLSQVDGWFDTTIDPIKDRLSSFIADLEAVGLVTIGREQKEQKEKPAGALAAAPSTPDIVLPENISFQTGGIIKYTKNNAVIFSLPGFEGGYFKGDYSPTKREDNLRSIPKPVIKHYDPTTHIVTVERRWYEKPSQRDLRDFVNGKRNK
jgi:hypothetical protein